MLYSGKLLACELYDSMGREHTNVKRVWEARHSRHAGRCVVMNAHWFGAGPMQIGNYKVAGQVLSDQWPGALTGFGWNAGALPEWTDDMGGVENFICTIPAFVAGERQSLEYEPGVCRAAARTWLARCTDGEWCAEVTSEPYTLEEIAGRIEKLGGADAMIFDGSGSSQAYDGETHITGDGREIYSYLLLWFEQPEPEKEEEELKIIETDLRWAYALTPLKKVDYIVLHHEAGTGSVEDVHRYHLNKGWAGIAYHYFVRLDGSIYRGRPENMQGGHCSGYNNRSLGICAEGNFETQTMPDAQRDALRALVSDVHGRYPEAKVVRHSDLLATACPGKNYPFDYITSEEEIDVNNPIYEKKEDVAAQAPWGLATFEKLVKKGYLNGEGGGVYNISRDMLRILVILDRAGQFD